MPTVDSSARVHTASVVDRCELTAGVVVLGLNAPGMAATARAGQFVMAVPPSGEAPATALGVYEAEGERISLLFFITGKRTQQLADLRPGDALDLLGPLGNGFDLTGARGDTGIVAGGTGIASVLLAAQTLRARGERVRLFYGARTARRLVGIEPFEACGCEVVTATDDGSRGHHGTVAQALAAASPPALLLACGPTPMLRAVARIAREFGVRAQLSLEETFACGVGGCWGCVIPIARTSAQAPSFPSARDGGSDTVNARICKEGPVFWSDELRW